MLPGVERDDDPAPAPAPAAAPATAPALTVVGIYDRHAPFVWRTLRALGVDAAAIDDAVQDVFVVVHQRLADFEGRAAVTTWLYGIARRVAAQHRRRARREPPEAPPAEVPESPLASAQRREAARLVVALLAELDDDKREVFALVELEQLTAPAVADLLGIPLNTVYSRLRLARARFEAALARRLPPEDP